MGSVYFFLSRSLCRCALCIVGFCPHLCAGQSALFIVGFCLYFCAGGLCIFVCFCLGLCAGVPCLLSVSV